MRIIPLTGTEPSALADRLATFAPLRDLPRTELEWLVSHGQFRIHDTGEIMLTPSDEANELIVQLSGRIVVYMGESDGRRHPMESRAGSLTGLLPFSRLKHPPRDVICEESAEVLTIHRRQFPELIRACPVLTESLVHLMLDRARRFSAASWQDEKVMSLGRLAAGLAHELNNPASAAASGATRLTRGLKDVGLAAHRFGIADVPASGREHVIALVERCQTAGRPDLRSFVHADRAERLTEWLEAHDLDPDCATALVDGGIGVEDLDHLATVLPSAALPAGVGWVGAAAANTVVADDVGRATRRIHDVVSAVRDFTHLDRPPVKEPTDVARGLADTVALLQSRARQQGTALGLDVPANLPTVQAVVADLNQAWSCLIENALDAVTTGGEVSVRAVLSDSAIIVTVADDGPEIPEDIQSRVFDPFFTTKPVGKGIGLGLDIVRRIAGNHGGEVTFTSEPGRTEFRVRLPAAIGGNERRV
jgi:signal transduction histidine kinase